MNAPLPAQTACQADMALVADLARRAAEQSSKPQAANYLDARPFLVLKDETGREVINWLREYREPPHRKTGAVTLFDATSFIAYVNLHGSKLPIYATPNPARFVAILNDHGPKPGHKDFTATLELKHSDEWSIWTKHNGNGAAFNSTESFALFLEENALDIIEPDAAQFLELALNFHVNEQVQFAQVQRLQDGQVQLTYNKIVDGTSRGAGGEMKVPHTFTINVPVFSGIDQPRYECEARFRYRLSGGKLTIWYDLSRPAKVVEQAFKDLWGAIASCTESLVLYGTAK